MDKNLKVCLLRAAQLDKADYKNDAQSYYACVLKVCEFCVCIHVLEMPFSISINGCKLSIDLSIFPVVLLGPMLLQLQAWEVWVYLDLWLPW